MSEILSREVFEEYVGEFMSPAHIEKLEATIEALAEELEWSRCPLTNERYEYLAKDEVNRSRKLREKGWLYGE